MRASMPKNAAGSLRGPSRAGLLAPPRPRARSPRPSKMGTSARREGSAPVDTYTFTLDGRELADERVTTRKFEDDASAVIAAADLLGDQVQSVGVARGSEDELEWLGAWDWYEGRSRYARGIRAPLRQTPWRCGEMPFPPATRIAPYLGVPRKGHRSGDVSGLRSQSGGQDRLGRLD